MQRRSQRRRRNRGRRRTAPTATSTSTTNTTMSGLTVPNNNPSSSSSFSSTPIFSTPSASPNPSTCFAFFTQSSSPAPLFATPPLFVPSWSFGESCVFGSSTGTISSGSADARVSSSSNPLLDASSSPKTSPPTFVGSEKSNAGMETPVQEKSVIEEDSSSITTTQEAVDIPQMKDFDGITLAADKFAVLLRIQLQHPTCLSSLRLRSKSHRRAAYDHLLKVIMDLKALGCDGEVDSYAQLVPLVDDLEFYGFDMSWFRVILVELEKNAEMRKEVGKEMEDKRKAREELMKQIEAIDAELAAKEVPPPVSMETLSALFE